MTIGKSHPAPAVVVARGQFRELTGSVGKAGVGIEDAIINAIWMFICEHPALAWARSCELIQLFRPKEGGTPSKREELSAVAHGSIHGNAPGATTAPTKRSLWLTEVGG